MRNKNISIPETCSQTWLKMTLVENGRHCLHCSKNVIDFTVMSNAEIIQQLSIKNNVCGQFNEFQLDSLNEELRHQNKRHFKWGNWVAAASIVSLITFSKVSAKACRTYNTEQISMKKSEFINSDTIYKTIRGTVMADDTVRLSNTNIYVKGTAIETRTDEKGEFKINVPVTADTLEILFTPYKKQYVRINPANKSNYDFKLNLELDTDWINKHRSDKIIMGEIRIKPGQKFNKELIKRSEREIKAQQDTIGH